MAVVGVALIALGVGYAGLCAAQFMGRGWFLLRKPSVTPTREQLRAGAAFGLIIAATPMLFGMWFLGIHADGNVGFGLWLGFTVSCLVFGVAMRWRRRREGASRRQG